MVSTRKKEIYFDNAAATPVDPSVLRAMKPYWNKFYGNPSSFNDAGRAAKKAVTESRSTISRLLGAKQREILFTSSATEANNMAVFGIAEKITANVKKPHFITTAIEHSSVLEPFKKLEKSGHAVTYLKPDAYGTITPESLKKALKKNTVLVSIMYANNEVGAIQPIKKLSKIIKDFRRIQNKKLPNTNYQLPFFHTDAAQTAGYLDINANNLGVDLMTVNAAKIYGPKGIGLLYVRRGTPCEPLVLGGTQEHGMRAGTEAVPLIVGFATALERARKNSERNVKREERLRNYFITRLQDAVPEAVLNGPVPGKKKTGLRLPNNINISVPGMESEQLLLYLDTYGIRASSGSACTSHSLEASHVLTALGVSEKLARSSIRFSLGKHTTKKDIDTAVAALKETISKLKKLYPPHLEKLYYS